MSDRPSVQVTENNLTVEILESPAIVVEVSGEETRVDPEIPGEPVEVSIVNDDPTGVEVLESLTRVEVSSENVILVTPASTGLQGPPGAAGDMVLTDYLAGEALGGDRVVIVGDDSRLYYADNTNLAHLFRILGVTNGAADPNAQANVRTGGVMAEPTWNWSLDQFIYLGRNGLLTQIIPAIGFLIVVGWPITPTKVMVDVKIPLVLA
jgi:hypothetical protein